MATSPDVLEAAKAFELVTARTRVSKHMKSETQRKMKRLHRIFKLPLDICELIVEEIGPRAVAEELLEDE